MKKGQKMSPAQRKALSRACLRPEARLRKSEATKAVWASLTPAQRTARVEAARAAWNERLTHPEARERMSAAAAKAWKDPKKRRNRMRAAADPETRKRKSESMKLALAEPEMRERMGKARKREWADPVIRERRLEAVRKSNADPKRRKKMGKGVKAVWASYTPAQRAARVEAMQTALNSLRSRGNRPHDWAEKPIAWRIIGGELLSRDGYMSNEELGLHLDASSILKCPYAAEWETAFSRAGSAANLLTNIRTWVGRPGKSLRRK